MADMGRTANSEVLEMTPVFIEESSPEVLQDKIGSSCLRLVRLRFGDQEPIGIQSSTILMELCPGLEKYDFNHHGLYDTLASEYHLIITQIQHTIGATTADEFQAELLGISEGDPMLVVKTSAFLENQQVVEHTISYYRADKYEYSTTHTYSA